MSAMTCHQKRSYAIAGGDSANVRMPLRTAQSAATTAAIRSGEDAPRARGRAQELP